MQVASASYSTLLVVIIMAVIAMHILRISSGLYCISQHWQQSIINNNALYVFFYCGIMYMIWRLCFSSKLNVDMLAFPSIIYGKPTSCFLKKTHHLCKLKFSNLTEISKVSSNKIQQNLTNNVTANFSVHEIREKVLYFVWKVFD